MCVKIMCPTYIPNSIKIQSNFNKYRFTIISIYPLHLPLRCCCCWCCLLWQCPRPFHTFHFTHVDTYRFHDSHTHTHNELLLHAQIYTHQQFCTKYKNRIAHRIHTHTSMTSLHLINRQPTNKTVSFCLKQTASLTNCKQTKPPTHPQFARPPPT